eukprot:225416-Alexandrium_andersonii.AAC.1
MAPLSARRAACHASLAGAGRASKSHVECLRTAPANMVRRFACLLGAYASGCNGTAPDSSLWARADHK